MDGSGTPIARANSREAVEQAVAGQPVEVAMFVTGADFDAHDAAQAEPAPAAVPAIEPVLETARAEPAKADGSAFDHDGDGKAGGSHPKKVAAKK